MYFFISPHVGSDWKKIQKRFIDDTTRPAHEILQYKTPKGMRHIDSIRKCLKWLDSRCKEGDICILLDSDAFPIRSGWHKEIVSWLDKYRYVAIQRLEATEARHLAHPAFVAWRFGRNVTFSVHGTKRNPHVAGSENQKAWKGIHKSNKKSLHPRLYTVYGSMIYHHGAGSRDVSDEKRFASGLQYGKRFWEDPKAFIRSLM